MAYEFPEDLGKHLGKTPASPWRLPEIRSVAEKINARRVAIHQRDYGTPYLKPTGFLLTLDEDPSFGVEGWPIMDDVGNYVGPLAYKAGPHMLLGKSNTGKTAAYPPALCKKLADMVVYSI